VTSPQVPNQSESHAKLLDDSGTASARAWFDAIVVPTHRPADGLKSAIELAQLTKTTLIVMCSRAATQEQVYEQAAQADVEVFAFDLPLAKPLSISLRTSLDKSLAAASPSRSRDLSLKRNIGLVLARLSGWERLMFLDDDIHGIDQHNVTALAAALDNHNVSALIPTWFPDNSVVCHAHRDSGGTQDVFASASGIGVRCDREDVAFFPNVYNEDWFFFADDAARKRIARVGDSRQRQYDPYDSPDRARWEEFGDLLAEGLYARLDIGNGIWDVDRRYWKSFIERRRRFHRQVSDSLGGIEDPEKAARAARSIRAAQDQLEKITPGLCQKFMRHWRRDLRDWQRYLTSLPQLDSLTDAFKYLGIEPGQPASVR
jgi:glycosyltransferase involved in cell wall biosynthesis